MVKRFRKLFRLSQFKFKPDNFLRQLLFKVPNLVIRKLYVERLAELLLPHPLIELKSKD